MTVSGFGPHEQSSVQRESGARGVKYLFMRTLRVAYHLLPAPAGVRVRLKRGFYRVWGRAFPNSYWYRRYLQSPCPDGSCGAEVAGVARTAAAGGGLTYEQRKAIEIVHYAKAFRGRMGQAAPPIWDLVEEHFADHIERATGVRNLYQYVARHVRGKKRVSVLGLGSGTCGNELDGIAPLLREQGCAMELTCLDINGEILAQARAEAAERGVEFHARTMDANEMVLEPGRYDVIVAYSALHHFLALEHVAEQIGRALKEDGIFVTVDVPTRNGYLMWDETLEMVNAIWKTLPDKYKWDHAGHAQPVHVERYENDFAQQGFECINSEGIIPALRKHLREVDFVPILCIGRRFFDGRFGPNFRCDDAMDMAIFRFVMALDQYYLDAGALRAESFFGAYRKTSGC